MHTAIDGDSMNMVSLTITSEHSHDTKRVQEAAPSHCR